MRDENHSWSIISFDTLFFMAGARAELYEFSGILWTDLYHFDKRGVDDSSSAGLASNNILDIGRKETLSFHGDFTARIDRRFDHGPQGDKTDYDLELNQAFVEKRLLDNLYFTLGKRRFLWGVSLARNPIDFINPRKNSFDPDQAKIGVLSAALDYYKANNTLSLLLTVPDDCSYTSVGMKYSMFSVIWNTDLHIAGYYSKKSLLNLGCAVDSTPFGYFPVLSDIAMHAELALLRRSELKEDKQNFFNRFLAGFRYLNPDTETFLSMEYFYSQDGYKGTIDPSTVPWDRIDIEYMGKHNIVISLSQPKISRACAFTDTLAITGTWLLNPLDKSHSIITRLESSLFTNWLISIENSFFSGEDDTQYGLYHLHHYFRMKVEFYF